LKFGRAGQNALEKSANVQQFCEAAAPRGLDDLARMAPEMTRVQH
jgi:hypothetical protein